MKNKILKSRIILSIVWLISFTTIMLSLLRLIPPVSAATYWALWSITIAIATHFNIYNKEWYSRYRSIACRWMIVKLSKRVMHEDQRSICLHVLMASMHLYRLEEQLTITTSNELMDLKMMSIMRTKGKFKDRVDELINDRNLKQTYSRLYRLCNSKKPINNN